ncbi:hypothetical protein D0T84_10225 [Dysgonomonas sp. 521]|uniref:FISUMP domain-containing protein n=1 Tax=Dysgonomonas sp. 521 TaxID=2302932 RepID=UPI0013D30908|nr:FISUMP domain-containing protein [Dysgonomonas sp. 521]NDV95295.1 hypothetical protein [Dysgonomonas sp. 521]
MKKILISIILLLAVGLTARAQVSIGGNTPPQNFSVLEIFSNDKGGLRLPQLTATQRQELEDSDKFQENKTGTGLGLTIFNMTNNCVETWDGVQWISMCADATPPLNPDDYETGEGTLTGKTCFDIAETGDKVTARKAEKTNFAIQTISDKKKDATSVSDANYTIGDNTITYSGIKEYVFTPEGTVSNVRFAFIDPTGIIVASISGGIKGTVTAPGTVIATVTYKSDLNSSTSILRGLSRGQAKKVDIYAIYNDNADGTGEDKAIKLTASFQDCACSGAAIDGGVWLTFMSHNLGADQTLDPLTPAAGIHGAKHRFGAKLPSLTMAEDQANSGEVTGWNSKPVETTTKADWSAANNPCPTGWRLPTHDEWEQVKNTSNNTQTVIGSDWKDDPTNYDVGRKVGDALFLPAAGYRATGNDYVPEGKLLDRGWSGSYWSSTNILTDGPFGGAGQCHTISFFKSSLNMISEVRTTGLSVRCVAQ